MKVAINQRTKKIVELMPDEAKSDSAFLQSNNYIMLDILEPVSEWNEEGEFPVPIFRELTIEELTPYLAKDINSRFEDEVSKLTADTPSSEVSTWLKQESEARKYLEDTTAPTPLIDAICEARECPKAYLIGKIIEKADKYSYELGVLTGIRQKEEKLLIEHGEV